VLPSRLREVAAALKGSTFPRHFLKVRTLAGVVGRSPTKVGRRTLIPAASAAAWLAARVRPAQSICRAGVRRNLRSGSATDCPARPARSRRCVTALETVTPPSGAMTR
jgi:hypothetical protein